MASAAHRQIIDGDAPIIEVGRGGAYKLTAAAQGSNSRAPLSNSGLKMRYINIHNESMNAPKNTCG